MPCQTQAFNCCYDEYDFKLEIEIAAGLIRRFLPKKTDFATISHQQIKYIETLLNNRPRKCLDYKTPAEVFNSSVALAG